MYSLAQNQKMFLCLFICLVLQACLDLVESLQQFVNYACKKQKYPCSGYLYTHKTKQKPFTSVLSLLCHLLWNKKIKFSLLLAKIVNSAYKI